MSSCSPFQKQYDYTVQLNRAFKGNFSYDDLHIAESYFHFTKLNPFIFRWLKEQRLLSHHTKAYRL